LQRQRFDDVVLVGVDAEVAGDFQRLLDDGLGRQLGIAQQAQRRRLGVGAAGADGGQAVFRFQHVAVAGQDQRVLGVGHDQHGFQAAQDAVGAPVAGQLDRGAHQVALVLFQLGFEAFLQGERVGGGAGEPGQDLVVVQAADLAGRALDDDVAQGDLAIAAQCDAVPAAHAHDGGGVKLFHAFLPLKGIAGGGSGEIKGMRGGAQCLAPVWDALGPARMPPGCLTPGKAGFSLTDSPYGCQTLSLIQQKRPCR
jgi:hypothetical protein